jgi:hypothetical protein
MAWSPVRKFGGYQIVGSTAWKNVVVSAGEEGKSGHDAPSKEDRAQAIKTAEAHAPVNPMEFFEHGHDC